jgi:hypothetical protein
MGAQRSNDVMVSTLNKRISAIEKYLKRDKPELPVQGVLLKPAAILELYKKSLDARAAVAAGLAAHRGAIKVRDEAEAIRLAADETLKAWVLGRYGAGSTEAAEFGYVARKAPEVTAATRAAAVLQNRATREARGTVGKKKKLRIKGVVPTSPAPAAPAIDATSAPAEAPVAPPSSPQPAVSSATTVAPHS